MVEEAMEPDLRARDREITEIAKSIAQLAELFKDLSSLVIDQGTLLDSVEYNIEQTSVHVAEAVTELKIAARYVFNHHHLPFQTFLSSFYLFALFLAIDPLPFLPFASPAYWTSLDVTSGARPSLFLFL